MIPNYSVCVNVVGGGATLFSRETLDAAQRDARAEALRLIRCDDARTTATFSVWPVCKACGGDGKRGVRRRLPCKACGGIGDGPAVHRETVYLERAVLKSS